LGFYEGIHVEGEDFGEVELVRGYDFDWGGRGTARVGGAFDDGFGRLEGAPAFRALERARFQQCSTSE